MTPSGSGPPAARPGSRESVALRRTRGPAALLGKVAAVAGVTLQTRAAYLGELFVRCLFLLVILFTFTQLWKAAGRSQSVEELTGFTLGQLIWYLAFTEAIITSARSLTEMEVDEEVRSGNLAYKLARPLPYPLFHLGSEMGERLLRFAVNLAAACAVARLVAGPIPWNALALPFALTTALVAFLIDFEISFTISLGSFWIEDTTGLHLLYRRLLMLGGGMLIPLEAYPDWLQKVTRALPFQYLVYQPARLFVQPDALDWIKVLLTQGWMCLAAAMPLLLVYRLGMRRVTAQGG